MIKFTNNPGSLRYTSHVHFTTQKTSTPYVGLYVHGEFTYSWGRLVYVKNVSRKQFKYFYTSVDFYLVP